MRRALLLFLGATAFGVQLAEAHECGPDILKLRRNETVTYIIIAGAVDTDYVVSDPGTNVEVGIISPAMYTQAHDGVFEILGLAVGTTTITIAWDSKPYGDEFAAGSCEVKVRVAPPFINSTGDAADIAPGDGMCDTDGIIDRDGEEEIECTLRAAIQESNAIVGPDEYPYDIPTTDGGHEGGGKFRILAGGSLPSINDPLFLDGETALGKNGSSAGSPTTSITLDGSGFVLGVGAVGSTLAGHTIINAPAAGIQIDANATTVRNSFIGTTIAGSLEDGNAGSGVLINGNDNAIGGSSAADQIIIAGNGGYGIEIHGDENRILGNWIGVNPDGITANANSLGGVAILAGGANEIGGETTTAGVAPGNVISGNGPEEISGIIIRSDENLVKGNLIGLDPTGKIAMGNGAHGIEIVDSNDNIIGDLDSDSGNRIAHNQGDGIRISGTSLGNAIVRNEIFKNVKLGIDLGGSGVSPNDPADADDGPNKLQNFPTITYRTSKDGQTRVDGVLSSTPNTAFRLEFFANDSADESGYGEADDYLDNRDVSTNGEGIAEFSFQLDGVHDRVVATATDPENNTSEISKAPLLINSVGDDADNDASDGQCNTGGVVGSQKECSLRAAIQEANHLAGPDVLSFDIPGSGPFSILVNTPLPTVSEELTIDGTSQVGFTPETIAVEVNGQNISASGLTITADKATLRGLTIRDFDGDGLQFSGSGALTLSRVQLKNNTGHGLYATSDVKGEALKEGDAATIEALGNGKNGISLEGGVKLIATGLVRANLNGSAFSRPNCDNVAGILVVGTIELEDVEADNNCGTGVDVRSNVEQGGSTRINGSVQLTNNFRFGLISPGPIDITGGFVQIDENDADGIRTTGTVKIAGEPGSKSEEGEGIRFKNNGLIAIQAEENLTLSGKALIKGNGFGNSSSGCFFNRYGAVVSEHGSVATDAITVTGNCGSGIIAIDDITINGNATITDNGGSFGIWGNGSILLKGLAHEISRNGDRAIWSADSGTLKSDGQISVSGSLIARGNGTKLNESECHSNGDPGDKAAISTNGTIRFQDIDISDNCHSGVWTLRSITVSGNARVRGNAGYGLFAGNPGLFITGASHDISNNGLDGVVILDRSGGSPDGIVSGHLQIRNNNTYVRENDADACETGDKHAGLWAKYSRLVFDRLTALGNCGNGILARNLTVNGVVKVNLNTRHGILATGLLRMNTGQVCTNGGWGIIAGRFSLVSVQVCENEAGGIAGQGVASKGGTLASEFGAVSLIDGASIVDNLGSGISGDGHPINVVNSNISGNADFGVSSVSSSQTIVADDNWWGDATGPGGTGPGAGDKVGDGVEVKSWLSKPVGLVVGSAVDTLFVRPGDTASVSFSFRNWLNEDDALTISIENEAGWLQNPGLFPLQLSDTLVTVVSRNVIVPLGKRALMSYVKVTAVSTLDDTQVARDSILVLSYEPALTTIAIEPDTLTLSSAETQTFRAFASDQAGVSLPVAFEWSASGGSIDQNGMFTAGDIAGFFAVVAKDPSTGLTGSAVAHVLGPVGTEKTASLPANFALQTPYPNPFLTSTTIPFELRDPVHVTLVVHNIVGQRVRTLADQLMPAGKHAVILERGELTTGMYFVFLDAGGYRSSRTVTLVK